MDIKAKAKINIGLGVLEKLPSGYHRIESLMVPLALADELRLKKLDRGFELLGDHFGEEDLVYKTHEHMEEVLEGEIPLQVEIHKKIPVGAGLGGGSADGAALIRAVRDLYDLPLGLWDLLEISEPLGADFPYCILSQPTLCRGIGDQLDPAENLPNYPVLLVNPGFSISTQEAYEKTLPNPKPMDYEKIMACLREGDLEGARPLLRNDLEAYAFSTYPQLEEIRDRLYKEGAGLAMMTGSGPTIFGLFTREEDRDQAYDRLEGAYPVLIKSQIDGWLHTYV
ncbi:MAG: 4-(cytidine 5'-diphospho)-2-C-methyl-D-erythritol kinase [Tissierellia bacterium]|nr:4-(cytidine 5'-diphospho)-2-C-methyl-D-erythritol kinase [Tissierellia bacterium]